jgi:hypothetical protein
MLSSVNHDMHCRAKIQKRLVARVYQRVGTIASDWFLNEYGILGITKLIGLWGFCVYYVYNANGESALPLAIYSIDFYFSEFCKLLMAVGNVTCNTRPSEAGGLTPPPPIISICISKTHKITRKGQKQLKFIQIYSWVPPILIYFRWPCNILPRFL